MRFFGLKEKPRALSHGVKIRIDSEAEALRNENHNLRVTITALHDDNARLFALNQQQADIIERLTGAEEKIAAMRAATENGATQ